MTIEQAKELIPDFDSFCKETCDHCSANDWYCPSHCVTLNLARNMDFELIQKSYARNDGLIWKVIRYIRQARIRGEK